ncbi:MAG TPA: DUF6600 domain-containing protein [Bryobacteraceae bacterium]|nr:DUF6600 domain-containing protein [Bryobacteraceae bacterium]
MLRRILRSAFWRSLLAAAVVTTGLFAQQPPEQYEDDNQPGRGVARISLLRGDVSVRRGDSGEWIAGAINAPLMTEDRVQTAAGSQVEVQLDYANLLRLASNGEIRFVEVEDGRYLMQLSGGTITFRVLRDSRAEVEISTPAVAVHPVKKGIYRVTIMPDGTTEITVRSGELEVSTPRGVERLKSGRTMLVRGNPVDPEFQMIGAIPRDDWDLWNDQRDRELERAISYRYVDPSITGAEDLDSNGEWAYDEPYGYVWTPTGVGPDWAPYRNGRWSWLDFYGWSWVSYDRWGWAPYHYGRWYHGSRGWSWWPGAARTRQRWSPGLVAFVGFGAGAGSGFGHIGWVPLAPHEAYHPGYGWGSYRGYRNGHGRNINIVNNVNVANLYRNARVNNGLTAVNSGEFGRGRAGNYVRLNGNDLQRGSLVRGQVPVTPDRAALHLSDRELTRAPRASNQQGRFFSRRAPTRSERVPFEDQRRGLEEASRRTFGDRPAGVVLQPGAPVDTGSRRVGDGRTEGGFGRVAPGSPTPAAQEPAGNGGWRRFGDPRGGSSDRGIGRQSRPVPSENSVSSPPPSPVNPSNQDRNSGVRSRDNSWRRFGDPGDGGSRPADSGVWRSRQPESRPSAPVENRSMDRYRDNGNGRRFESNPWGGRAQEVPRPPRQQEAPARAPRVDAPRQAPREAPQRLAPEPRNNLRGGEPLRLSPPIVRERLRQNENFSTADNSGNRTVRFESSPVSHGGGGFSAPRGNQGSGGARWDHGDRGGRGTDSGRGRNR